MLTKSLELFPAWAPAPAPASLSGGGMIAAVVMENAWTRCATKWSRPDNNGR